MRPTAALLLLALPATSWALPTVLVVHADSGNVTEIQTHLVNAGAFDSVTLFNANTSSPSAGYLATFDAVLVYLNSSFQSPGTVGQALVDYLAVGGGVVMANPPFMGGPAYSLPGAIANMLPMYQVAGFMGSSAMVYRDDASPILAGVGAVTGGGLHGNALVRPDAHLVASTADGWALVAEWEVGGGTLVGVNMFPISTALVGSSGYDGDGATLFVRALEFAAAGNGTPPGNELMVSTSGSCPGAVQVDVTGATPSGEVAFVTGSAADTYTPIPRGICESVGVPLSFPSLRAKRTADSSGNLSVSFGGFLVCGTGVVAVDMTTCRTTWQSTLP
jgi:hypothetical protein